MAGEVFVKLLNEAAEKAMSASDNADIVFGKVVKGGIKLDGGRKLNHDFFVVSKLLTEVFGGLEKGDKVAMIRFARGQRFYVIDKVNYVRSHEHDVW